MKISKQQYFDDFVLDAEVGVAALYQHAAVVRMRFRKRLI